MRTATGLLFLEESGHFTASEIPAGLVASQEEDTNKLVSGAGTWHLNVEDGRQVVQLDFEEIVGVSVGGAPFGTQVYLSKNVQNAVLYYFQADPDNSLEIDFNKR